MQGWGNYIFKIKALRTKGYLVKQIFTWLIKDTVLFIPQLGAGGKCDPELPSPGSTLESSGDLLNIYQSLIQVQLNLNFWLWKGSEHQNFQNAWDHSNVQRGLRIVALQKSPEAQLCALLTAAEAGSASRPMSTAG